jgi:tetratricopeptide (TPR) repeat protein
MGDASESLVGRRVGRYQVLQPLGAGGMAVVYAAHDPTLDRKVALKVLRARGEASARERARMRLLREAQALAGLSHPNIVTVLDVGVDGELVFLAMELVRGTTLGRWRDAKRRRTADILRVMIGAGRGLAAAHAQGFVHRDFKPDNVMVEADAHARVMDFGLVLGHASGPRAESEVDLDTPPGTDLELTRAGAAVGTPPYMAPEQHAQGEVSPRSDQYAFCVTLWELLYGRRPFDASSLEEYAALKERGPGVPPSPARGGPRVPAWLVRAMRRGLAPRPEDRHATMEALISELEHGRRTVRRRFIAAGALAIAVAGGSAPLLSAAARRRAEAACRTEATSVHDVWNDAAAETLEGALRAAGPTTPDATTIARAIELLDAYSARWEAARGETCEAADVRGELDAGLSERARFCLDERRVALDVQIRELSGASAGAVHRFVTSADALPTIEVCLDLESLRQDALPPQERRDRVMELRGELVRARTLAEAGEVPAAAALARRAREEAEALAWPPLLVEARVLVGTLAAEQGELALAEEELTAAFHAARTLDMSGVAVDSASLLAKVVGGMRDRPEEGLEWARHAEAAAERIPGDGRLRRALLRTRMASVHSARGEPERAMTLLEEAVLLYEEVLGAEHPHLGYALDQMAIVERSRDRYAEARALIDRGLRIRTAALGPDHPDVLQGRESLAALLRETGRLAEARAIFEDLLERRRRTSGARSVASAKMLSSLATTLFLQGEYADAAEYAAKSMRLQGEIYGRESTQYANELNTMAAIRRKRGENEEARRMFEEVLDLRERTLGPDHPSVTDAAMNVADAMRATGDLEGAEALLEATLVTQRRVLGDEHRAVALAVHNLANLRLQRGAHARAMAGFAEAIALMEGSIGPEHPYLAYPLTGLGTARVATGDPEAAIEPLERALALRTAQASSADERRETRSALADALWQSGRDRTRAVEVAQEALADAREAGDTDRIVECAAWLSEHATTR